MNCRSVRTQLAERPDRALDARAAAEVEQHLLGCRSCSAEATSLQEALEDLRALPRLEAPESIAASVLARIEAETRGPGLRALYVTAWARRPLLLPSLVPAVLLLGALLGTALLLDPAAEELPPVAAVTVGEWNTTPVPAPGPPLPVAAVALRRLHWGALGEREVLDHMVEGSLFVETVVGTDGNVSAVHVLAGNQELAAPLRDALWQERFAPTRYRGRLVEVSVYRLISRMEVRAPLT